MSVKSFKIISLSIALLFCLASSLTFAATVTDTATTTAASGPFGIVKGPDNNMWFTEYLGDKVGKITSDGTITEYAVGSGPAGITVGPDGNLWIAEYAADKIAKISTAGAGFTEYALPAAGSLPRSIVSGPDGNLWFTEFGGGKIGKITTAGVITEYVLPTVPSSPRGIAAGADGNLWFTMSEGRIGKITTAGVITEYTLGSTTSPRDIISGSDGALWFSENGTNKIGRITTGGAITEFTIPTAASSPSGLVNGPAGTGIWFTEQTGKKIGHISPTGVFLGELAIATGAGSPEQIAVGADGNLWYTDYAVSKIGKVTLASTDLLSVSTSSLPSGLVGTAYSQTLSSTGGTSPYVYFLSSGTLPTGLVLSYNGTIAGTPTAAGTYTFTVEVNDDNLVSSTKSYTVTIADPMPELAGSYTSFRRSNILMTAKLKVTNNGTKDAGKFKVSFYVSSNDSIGTGDAKVVTSTVTSIAAGSSKTLSIRFIRGNLKRKYLIARIDVASQQDESDETNNDVAKKIS